MPAAIQHIARSVAPAGSWSGETLDHVTLDYDQRFRRRLLLECHDGTQVLLDLVKAQVLKDGDALMTDSGARILVVAKPEALLEVRCDDRVQLLRIAWHLGNRHLPTEIAEDRLRIRADHVIADMLRKLGADPVLLEAPFDPEGGAYGQGQIHGHDH